MKKTLALISLSVVSLLGFGQANPENQLLSSRYLAMKDALIKGDEKLTAEKASEFVKGIDKFHPTDANSKDQQLMNARLAKLRADGQRIANAKGIAAQRELFISFSDNFFALSKLTKTSELPLYQFYCPMKKAIWLSSDSSVKNPYYGNQMLTCGTLQETIE